MITVTISHNAANVIGPLSQRAIKTLQQADFSVVVQEASYGLTGSLTIPLFPQSGLTWKGVQNCLELAGYQVNIVC